MTIPESLLQAATLTEEEERIAWKAAPYELEAALKFLRDAARDKALREAEKYWGGKLARIADIALRSKAEDLSSVGLMTKLGDIWRIAAGYDVAPEKDVPDA